MDIDERVKALENELNTMKAETQKLMLEIRAILMENRSPLRNQAPEGSQLNQDSRQRGAPNGNRR
jgi:hypothetical protein